MPDALPFVTAGPGQRADLQPLLERAATRWSLPSPQLVRIGMNALFTAGDVVLRVSRPNAPAQAALELADVLTAAGVRVPRYARDEVVVDGALAVTAWERLVPNGAEVDWREVGRMVALVHELRPGDLPGAYPRPRCETFPWWRFDELLAEVSTALDDEARAGILTTIEGHRTWADGVARVVCHGDVHPDNVIMTTDGAVLLDWDLLCAGPPAWDHAPLMRLPLWGWPARWYDEFAAGYGRSLVGDPAAEALADLRLVAATLMRLRAGLADPQAMPEAQLRLDHWRHAPNSRTWTPV